MITKKSLARLVPKESDWKLAGIGDETPTSISRTAQQ
jgi:hypothetical protein